MCCIKWRDICGFAPMFTSGQFQCWRGVVVSDDRTWYSKTKMLDNRNQSLSMTQQLICRFMSFQNTAIAALPIFRQIRTVMCRCPLLYSRAKARFLPVDRSCSGMSREAGADSISASLLRLERQARWWIQEESKLYGASYLDLTVWYADEIAVDCRGRRPSEPIWQFQQSPVYSRMGKRRPNNYCALPLSISLSLLLHVLWH